MSEQPQAVRPCRRPGRTVLRSSPTTPCRSAAPALEPSGPTTTTSAPSRATPRIADGSSAEEPAAARPESVVQASTNLFDAPPPLARVAPPEQAPPDLPTDEDDISIDDLIHESLPSDAAPGQPVRTADLDDLLLDAEEDESGDTLSAVEAPTARIETTGPPPFRSVIGRSRAERSDRTTCRSRGGSEGGHRHPVEDSSVTRMPCTKERDRRLYLRSTPAGPRVGGAPPPAPRYPLQRPGRPSRLGHRGRSPEQGSRPAASR